MTSNNQPPNDSEQIFAVLAERLTALQEEIEAREIEAKNLRERALSLTNNTPGTYAAGKMNIIIRRGANRLDQKKFAADHPMAQYPKFYEPKLNTTAVKKGVAADDLEQYQTTGPQTVMVKA